MTFFLFPYIFVVPIENWLPPHWEVLYIYEVHIFPPITTWAPLTRYQLHHLLHLLWTWRIPLCQYWYLPLPLIQVACKKQNKIMIIFFFNHCSKNVVFKLLRYLENQKLTCYGNDSKKIYISQGLATHGLTVINSMSSCDHSILKQERYRNNIKMNHTFITSLNCHELHLLPPSLCEYAVRN